MRYITLLVFLLLSGIMACDSPDMPRAEHLRQVESKREREMTHAEMVKIEGGRVDPFGTGDRVSVAPFYLDKHLVTYEQYNEFIRAGGYKNKKYWSAAGQAFLEKYEFWAPSTYYDNYLNRQALPVTGVSWYEAEAYAKWRGARLPTAAEWSLACQGSETPRRYPWGDAFDFAAIDYRSRLAPYVVGSREQNISPVGVFDLVGNVWQWCADSYEGRDFRLDGEPTGRDAGTQRVLRGGGWMSIRTHFGSDYLYYDKPFQRLCTYGFRCARDLN